MTKPLTRTTEPLNLQWLTKRPQNPCQISASGIFSYVFLLVQPFQPKNAEVMAESTDAVSFLQCPLFIAICVKLIKLQS